MKFLDMFFKKKQQEDDIVIVGDKRTVLNKSVYCELIWEENNPRVIRLYGYNLIENKKTLCSNNIFHGKDYQSTQPSEYIYVPRILYDIDWDFIFKNKLELKSFKIIFKNYMEYTREYTVIIECINYRNKKVADTFSSTIKVFINPFELTDNINKFFRYAEKYK